LLRPSGTESVLRVMVECEDPHLAANLASVLALEVELATSSVHRPQELAVA
jgi:phosphomannomutase